MLFSAQGVGSVLPGIIFLLGVALYGRIRMHGHLARYPWNVNTNAGVSGMGTTDST